MTAEPQTDDWRALLHLQDGVLARGQGLRTGLSEDAWQHRLDRGVWQSLLPGVAVSHSGPVTERQQAWAALLYCGRGAALTGLAALRLDGSTLTTRCVDVAVPAGRRVRVQPSPAWRRLQQGSVAHVPVVLPRPVADLEGLVHAHALPRRVGPVAALLHAAAWAPSARAAETYVAAAVQQGLVVPPAVRGLLSTMPRLPRAQLLHQVLDDVERGAQARGELDLLALLREGGLPEPDSCQHRLRGGGTYYVDAWWERQRVAVEVDGAHHRDVVQWEADLLRSNELTTRRAALGATVLRFTTGQVRHDRGRVTEQLRAALLP